MSEHAPGAPGIPPTWTSSAKDMVGCALGTSRLWFTLGFGIVNEVYYPRVDHPADPRPRLYRRRRRRFLGRGQARRQLSNAAVGAGRAGRRDRARHERYSLRLRISPGSRRDVLAIECRLDGDDKLRLYVLLAPHLGATGYGNTAAVVSHRGRLTLCAEQGPFGTALAAVDEQPARCRRPGERRLCRLSATAGRISPAIGG